MKLPLPEDCCIKVKKITLRFSTNSNQPSCNKGRGRDGSPSSEIGANNQSAIIIFGYWANNGTGFRLSNETRLTYGRTHKKKEPLSYGGNIPDHTEALHFTGRISSFFFCHESILPGK